MRLETAKRLMTMGLGLRFSQKKTGSIYIYIYTLTYHTLCACDVFFQSQCNHVSAEEICWCSAAKTDGVWISAVVSPVSTGYWMLQSVLASGVHCIAFGYVVSCIPYASLYQSHLPQKNPKRLLKRYPKDEQTHNTAPVFVLCFCNQGELNLNPISSCWWCIYHICHNRIPMTHFTTALWMITMVFAKYSTPKKDAQKCARILIFDDICFILGMFHDFPTSRHLFGIDDLGILGVMVQLW